MLQVVKVLYPVNLPSDVGNYILSDINKQEKYVMRILPSLSSVKNLITAGLGISDSVFRIVGCM